MKIAIQGHPTRGKEVIQILENLGGINRISHSGKYANYFYYISNEDNIIAWTCIPSECFKVYTLEEFERDFPFKIGDKVTVMTNEIYKVVALEYYISELSYKLDNGLHYSSELLTLYKEMKEERNITLTLKKAKEWYKKGGELKEVALQAYSEEELNKIDLPKTWKEFCDNYPVKDKEAHFDSISNIFVQKGDTTLRASIRDRNICPSQKSAEAHLAMIQLEQLRNCWWSGWEPKWNNGEKHVIKWEGNTLTVFLASRIHAFLVFPTREMAEEFLECFRDLIEKAGDLI